MLIFADEGGEGGVSGNADVIMSFCEKGKKNYCAPRIFTFIFFALDKGILKNPKSIKKTLTFSTLFRNFSKLALASYGRIRKIIYFCF